MRYYKNLTHTYTHRCTQNSDLHLNDGGKFPFKNNKIKREKKKKKFFFQKIVSVSSVSKMSEGKQPGYITLFREGRRERRDANEILL